MGEDTATPSSGASTLASPTLRPASGPERPRDPCCAAV